MCATLSKEKGRTTSSAREDKDCAGIAGSPGSDRQTAASLRGQN